MTTPTSFRYVLHLAWQALRPYSRHFLPLCSGALAAAVGQLQRKEALQPAQALRTALKAWKPLLAATGLFWLPAAGTAGFGYWVWNHTQTSPGQMLGGMLMIALVAGFMYYWWVRWSFLSQVIIEKDCGPASAFTRSSGLVAGHWWGVFSLSTVLSALPSLLENLLNLAGPWAVTVGQGLTGPLGTVGMTLLYWELGGGRREGTDE